MAEEPAHRPARPSAARASKFDRPSSEQAPHRPARPSAARQHTPAEPFDRPPRAEKFPRSPVADGPRHGPPQRVVRNYEQPEPSRGFAKRHDGSKIPKRHEGPGEKIAIWFSAGERAGIRPGDLVGAIANEAQIDSKLIGPIQIKESFSLVGIPAPMVDRVIEAMEKTTLRGRKVQVRRDR
jgi:ATP-dependent RNA helicase DeaD